MSENIKQNHILHSSMFNATVRDWHTTNYVLNPSNFVYPVFIIEDDNGLEPIDSMPGIFRYGLNHLKSHLDDVIETGLKSILIFGVITALDKDERGTNADSPSNPVIRALKQLTQWYPDLTLICDVCLCPYTAHGHCGIFDATEHTVIDNAKSIGRLAEISVAYAKAGANIIAPSDMQDGRIGAIKAALVQAGYGSRVGILSYTAKFASGLYGPFRDAAHSAPAFGDRKQYQLPYGGRDLALRAAARDTAEGADFLMVKPATLYMDIIRDIKGHYPNWPLATYHVSGEYAMLMSAYQKGTLNLDSVLLEVFTGLRRAGADIIITYFTPYILQMLKTMGHKN